MKLHHWINHLWIALYKKNLMWCNWNSKHFLSFNVDEISHQWESNTWNCVANSMKSIFCHWLSWKAIYLFLFSSFAFWFIFLIFFSLFLSTLAIHFDWFSYIKRFRRMQNAYSRFEPRPHHKKLNACTAIQLNGINFYCEYIKMQNATLFRFSISIHLYRILNKI